MKKMMEEEEAAAKHFAVSSLQGFIDHTADTLNGMAEADHTHSFEDNTAAATAPTAEHPPLPSVPMAARWV